MSDKNQMTYEVTVWDHEGDIVKKLWHATEKELREVEDRYANEPMFTVVAEENP